MSEDQFRKEKVNLTESVPGTGQQSIVTQYYADIAVTIYWVPAIARLVQINFHTDNIWTDTTSTIIGCDILCDDDHHSCFNIGQMSKWQRGQVKGTTVWFEVKECRQIEGHYQWANLPYEIRPTSGTKDSIFVYTTSSQTTKWYFIGFIYRRDVVAPECIACGTASPADCTLQPCDDYTTFPPPIFHNAMNKFDFTPNEDECAQSSDWLAVFIPVRKPMASASNYLDLTNDLIDICFNRELQKVEFNTHLFEFKVNSMIDICPNNFALANLHPIYTIDGIDSIPPGDCSLALESFEAHKEYLFDETDKKKLGWAVPQGGYIIMPALIQHEMNHKEAYDSLVTVATGIYYANIFNTDFKMACKDVNNNIDSAKALYKNMLLNNFRIFRQELRNEYFDYTGSNKEDPNWWVKLKRDERWANNKFNTVSDIVDQYIKRLKAHCGIN